METVKLSTRSVYETHAAAWDAQRGRSLFEKTWLDRLLARTFPGDTILDVGCGAGEPIARYIEEYEVRFREAGVAVAKFVPEDRDCAGHSVLLAVCGASRP